TRRLPRARRPPLSDPALSARPRSRGTRGRRRTPAVPSVAAGEGFAQARTAYDRGAGGAAPDAAPQRRPAGRPARGAGDGGAPPPSGAVVGPSAAADSTPRRVAAPLGAPVAAPARPAPREFVTIPELRTIRFDFDKYDIRPEDAKTLETNAAWLKANANHLV